MSKTLMVQPNLKIKFLKLSHYSSHAVTGTLFGGDSQCVSNWFNFLAFLTAAYIFESHKNRIAKNISNVFYYFFLQIFWNYYSF